MATGPRPHGSRRGASQPSLRRLRLRWSAAPRHEAEVKTIFVDRSSIIRKNRGSQQQRVPARGAPSPLDGVLTIAGGLKEEAVAREPATAALSRRGTTPIGARLVCDNLAPSAYEERP